jgi:glycosyltransferase involved in cell wall biosynthesis
MLVHNRERLVGRAIQSVINQSFEDFEFIIVDNGSDDNSGNICRGFAADDARITVIAKEKGNIGSGRNAGLDAARGDYITFVDDDDRAEPDMLACLYSLIIKHDADIAFCGSNKEVNGEIVPNYVFDVELVMDAGAAVKELLARKKLNSGMPTKLWRKNLFDHIRFLNIGTYDDIFIAYKLFAEARAVVAEGTPQYYVHRHMGNNSNFTTNDLLLTPLQLDEYYAAFRERTSYLSTKLPEIADYVRYSEWSYLISMVNKIVSNKLAHCDAQLAYARNCLVENRDEFYSSPYLQDFEREYMDQYI